MPIQLRRRGEVWHGRGSIRVGQTSIDVPSFSTGCRSRADAEAVAANREAEIRAAEIERGAGKQAAGGPLTIADAFAAYLAGGRLKPWDVRRVQVLNEAMGARALGEAAEAWRAFDRAHRDRQPATLARWRVVLAAALSVGAEEHGVAPPRLPPVRGLDSGAEAAVPFLTEAEADRLLAAYSEPARWVALALRYQGLRTQEALRLDWRQVDWSRRSLLIAGTAEIGRARTKSRRPRRIAMHRKVRVRLYLLWRSRGRPSSGAVFLSSRGEPYQDTRGHDGGAQGGNPLRRAHATACRKAGISGFTVHGWRHHWAAHQVMAGTDLRTLQTMGGWASLRMLERYSAVSAEHQAEAVNRVR
jgi:integrase